MVIEETDEPTKGDYRFSFRVDRGLKEKVTHLRTLLWPDLNETDFLKELVKRALPLVERGELAMFSPPGVDSNAGRAPKRERRSAAR